MSIVGGGTELNILYNTYHSVPRSRQSPTTWTEERMEIQFRRAKVDAPSKKSHVPEWARGRPDALTMMMDPRVQQVLYPDVPPVRKKRERRLL